MRWPDRDSNELHGSKMPRGAKSTLYIFGALTVLTFFYLGMWAVDEIKSGKCLEWGCMP